MKNETMTIITGNDAMLTFPDSDMPPALEPPSPRPIAAATSFLPPPITLTPHAFIPSSAIVEAAKKAAVAAANAMMFLARNRGISGIPMPAPVLNKAAGASSINPVVAPSHPPAVKHDNNGNDHVSLPVSNRNHQSVWNRKLYVQEDENSRYVCVRKNENPNVLAIQLIEEWSEAVQDSRCQKMLEVRASRVNRNGIEIACVFILLYPRLDPKWKKFDLTLFVRFLNARGGIIEKESTSMPFSVTASMSRQSPIYNGSLHNPAQSTQTAAKAGTSVQSVKAPAR